jgi:hypothetical protein
MPLRQQAYLARVTARLSMHDPLRDKEIPLSQLRSKNSHIANRRDGLVSLWGCGVVASGISHSRVVRVEVPKARSCACALGHYV